MAVQDCTGGQDEAGCCTPGYDGPMNANAEERSLLAHDHCVSLGVVASRNSHGIGSWLSFLWAFLARGHGLFKTMPVRHHTSLEAAPLLLHLEAHGEESHGIGEFLDRWDLLDKERNEQPLSGDTTHVSSSPLLAKIEKLSSVIKSQEEDIKHKEQQVFFAQSKIEQLTRDKEQLCREVMYWTQIAQTFERKCRELQKDGAKSSNEHITLGQADIGTNILEELASLSQELQKRREELRVKEEELSRKREDHHPQYFEDESKNLWRPREEHSQYVLHQANWVKDRGFGDAYLHGHHHHHHHQLPPQSPKALACKHEGELTALREQVEKYEKRHRELQIRTQSAEQMVAQYALVDTSHYQDGEATPVLLQSTSDAVKNALSMCSSNIFKFTQAHSLSINSSYFATSNKEHHLDMKGNNRKQVVKMALQAFLCDLLFHSFESPTYTFTMSKSKSVPFEKPGAHRKQRLEAFQKLRGLDPIQISKQNQEFTLFGKEKWELVLDKLHKLLCDNGDHHLSGEAQHAISKLVRNHLSVSSSAFHSSFQRLAKAVWLLHKVAFACEPASAEIFRVAPNSSFVEEYMTEHEDTQSKTVTHEEEEKDKVRIVALMNVPGFTLRNSIIKSVVCCFDSLSPPQVN